MWPPRFATGLVATPKRREALWLIAAIAVAVTVSLLAFSEFASSSFRVGPASFEAAVRVDARPSMTIAVPPFGTVSARTHSAPLAIRILLQEVDVSALDTLVKQGLPDQTVVNGYVTAFKRGVVVSGLRGLTAALIAGAAAGLVVRRRWWVALASAAASVLVPAVLLLSVYEGFDLGVFKSPTYHGALSYAPALVKLVEERVATVQSFRADIVGTARALSNYYKEPQSFATGGSLAGTTRVLHVSDLHMDPVGFELQRSLTREFDVSLVIDTGDADYFGSGVEGAFAASRLPTDVPTVFIPGNHDSPQVVAALRRLRRVRVLEATTTAIEGFVILGLADPASFSADPTPDHIASLAVATTAAADLRSRLASGEPTPTLVAVHDPAMTTPFEGLVGLILSGHTHTPSLAERGKTWLLGAGTTGGVDLGANKPDPHVPHSAAILYFTAETPRRLLAIDQIQVSGTDGSSTLKRTVVSPAAVGR